MSWGSFALGFIAFPLFLVILFILPGILRQVFGRGRRPPVIVRSSASLRTQIEQQMHLLEDREYFHVYEYAAQLRFRLIVLKRKTLPDTLRIDYRVDRSQPARLEAIQATLRENQIEFELELTPKARQPKRILIKYPDGGESALDGVTNALHLMSRAVTDETELMWLISLFEPQHPEKYRTSQ